MVRGGTPISLLAVAIDNFDELAATPGAADQASAGVIQALLPLAGRDPDLVARHGTNTFAVLLTGADECGAAGGRGRALRVQDRGRPARSRPSRGAT